jgi:hypothetical protein
MLQFCRIWTKAASILGEDMNKDKIAKLGVGAMLALLGGNESTVEAWRSAVNKKIKKLALGKDDNAVHFEFDDGTKVKFWDDGQSCCERRYMQTDDDLSYHEGSIDGYGDHEVQFLEFKTSSGTFTMASHNEHNGYYGGFAIKAEKE